MKRMSNDNYEKARKKVQEIKGFFTHLFVYVLVNIFLLVAQFGFFRNGFADLDFPGWAAFTTPFFWGIGLAFHGLYVFQHKFRFFKNWEERKIKEYMEKDEEEFKNTTRWD